MSLLSQLSYLHWLSLVAIAMAIVKIFVVGNFNVNKTFSMVTMVMLATSIMANIFGFINASLTIIDPYNNSFWINFCNYMMQTLPQIISLLQ